MSISFPGDLTIEEVPEGREVTVNQRQFTGPLTVLRSWPLRGVAVTPYGHDSETSMQFAEDAEITCTIISEESTEMSEDTKPVDEVEVEVTDEAVDKTDPDNVEAEVAVDATPEEQPAEAEALTEPTDGKAFMAKFGRVQGALYFAEGLTMDEAKERELDRLLAENTELRTRLTDDGSSLDEATGFSQGDGDLESDLLTEVPGERVIEVTEK